MPRDFFGRILLLDLGSLILLFQIMTFNLIVRPSEGTVLTLELRIGIAPRLTPKGMDKLRLLIRS